VPEQSGENKTGRAGALAGKIRSLPMAVKISVPLIMVLIIAAAIFLLYNIFTVERVVTRDRGPVVQSRDLDVRYRQLGKQRNIVIQDHDIFEYANRVAVKNGYHKIAPTKLRDRNPDWIYPENVFFMLDGQRVVVSRGDTLWNLSKNKLIESTIKFDDIMKQLNTADIRNKPRLINEARQHAFTSEQQEIFRKAMKMIPSNKRQGAPQ
jgi:hypothetical protein